MPDLSPFIPKAVNSNAMEIDPHILNDEPSTAVSTEALMGRDMAPGGLPASNKDPAPQKKTKKRDAFKEWLYRRKEEDTATVTETDTIFGKGTMPEPSTSHIGQGVALPQFRVHIC
jgi:hypothetical protein